MPVKRKRVLQDDAELAAQVLDVQFADVDAVEKDLPALDVVEAQQELDGGGLAGAGVADDGDGLAGLDAEGNVAQDPVFLAGIGAAVIGEPDVAKFDFAAHGLSERPPPATSAGNGSSSSLKMRSEAAMAACKILNLSLKS